MVRDWQSDDERWAAWMAAAQRGDKSAYESLLTEVSAAIRGYLRVRFGPADFVDDITQDCLLSIHRGRHTYDPGRPFRAWLFAIVRHRSIDYLRRSGGEPGPIDPDGPPAVDAIAPVVDAGLILSQLGPQHRDIILRTKYLGYSAGEVAAQLGISVTAVRVRLHRALRHARRLLDAEDQGPT